MGRQAKPLSVMKITDDYSEKEGWCIIEKYTQDAVGGPFTSESEAVEWLATSKFSKNDHIAACFMNMDGWIMRVTPFKP